jgi:hypothetical protein
MDDTPQTRKEKKGGRQHADKTIYSSKRARAYETLMSKKSHEIASSASKTALQNTHSSSSDKRR